MYLDGKGIIKPKDNKVQNCNPRTTRYFLQRVIQWELPGEGEASKHTSNWLKSSSENS